MEPMGRNIDEKGCCTKCGGNRFNTKKNSYTKNNGSESITYSFVCVDCASKYKHERDVKLRGEVDSRICKHCKKEFIPINYQQIFCSSKCNVQWWGDSRPRKKDHPDWEQYKKERRDYYHNVLKNNLDYMLMTKLRGRIYNALKRKSKPSTTRELVGCSVDDLKNHLQKTAISNGYFDFNINFYSGTEYHIDHIKPCSSFNLLDEEELQECFHYSNLQILSAHENLVKTNKVA